MGDYEYNHPRRAWMTTDEVRNTSWWISRGLRDNAAGEDRVTFHAFIPRGADATEIAGASNMLKRKIKAFIKRAAKLGYTPSSPSLVRPGIFSRRMHSDYDYLSTDIDGLELRDWLYFKIGIHEAMEVPL